MERVCGGGREEAVVGGERADESVVPTSAMEDVAAGAAVQSVGAVAPIEYVISTLAKYRAGGPAPVVVELVAAAAKLDCAKDFAPVFDIVTVERARRLERDISDQRAIVREVQRATMTGCYLGSSTLDSA